MIKKRDYTKLYQLIFSILICQLVGVASALLSQGGMSLWFPSLKKPSWNPPNYAFSIVWPILYVMMGISFWYIWKTKTHASIKRNAMGIFAIQLTCNFLWSIIFFKYQSPYYAMLEILILLISIILSIYYFALISSRAAWLLVPYLLWVCFASVLNYAIWSLNAPL